MRPIYLMLALQIVISSGIEYRDELPLQIYDIIRIVDASFRSAYPGSVMYTASREYHEKPWRWLDED